MRNDTMSPAEAREFRDRICDMRWERVEARATRRQAARALRAGIVRSIPERLARLLFKGGRGGRHEPASTYPSTSRVHRGQR